MPVFCRSLVVLSSYCFHVVPVFSFLKPTTIDLTPRSIRHIRQMRTLEVYDHVALKQNTRLHGAITRTNGEPDTPRLENRLNLAHTTIPSKVSDEFLATGVPPAGYVYVKWAEETDGCSLVDENDLTLLSRAFQVGDVVRQDGSCMTGKVIDVDETYTLAPLACDREVAKLLSVEQLFPSCSPACASHPPLRFSHPNPHALIYNVPSREIKVAQDVVRGDYLTSDKWIGLVSDVGYNVVIALENKSVVVVTGLGGICLPLEDNGIPLFNMFIRGDATRKELPDFANTENTYGVPVEVLRPGDHVVINHGPLREGRWIRGSYDPKCRRLGVVLDVRAREVTTMWLVNNRRDKSNASTKPRCEQSIYENIDTFQDQAQLTLNKYVSVYDSAKMPSKTATITTTLHSRTISGYPKDTQSVLLGLYIAVGTHVRFRDPTGAAVKYQGSEQNSHGRLTRVVSVDYPDWDFNEFIVVDMKQKATVLWQDGSTTTSDSMDLHDHDLFEPELQPTNIVVMREGMLQRPTASSSAVSFETSEFNEMALFERPHDLMPQKVGVIQTIDPRERVASIRWYRKPKIELLSSGRNLSHASHFGPIGDTVSDVSLYEILPFPFFNCLPRDMCVLADLVKVTRGQQAYETGESVDISLPTNSTSPRPGIERAVDRELSPISIAPWRMPKARTEPNGAGPRDWVGQVVATGLDGSLTVRLGAAQHCRDVRMDLDGLLACIPGDRRDMESVDGDLLDVDNFDVDIEISDDSSDDYSDADVEMGEVDDLLLDLTPEEADLIHKSHAPILTTVPPEPAEAPAEAPLSTTMPPGPPPQFLILDQEPPADQFGLQSVSSSIGALKRIAKEHKILASSLPKGQIYVRTYERRLDLFRCLMVGPRDTPYENAPFLIDLQLPERFPEQPPTAHFHSWTSGMGRINPNLYEEGKICLSLLGTWSGQHKTESWNPMATILQILVSLQGLVFVKNPFYNEAGFEGYEDDERYIHEAEQYNEKAFVMARRFTKNALVRPPRAMTDVLAWLYLPHHPDKPGESLLGTIISQGKLLIERSESARARNDESLLDSQGEKDDMTKVFLRPLSRGGIVMLKRTIEELQTELNRLTMVESCDRDGGGGGA